MTFTLSLTPWRVRQLDADISVCGTDLLPGAYQFRHPCRCGDSFCFSEEVRSAELPPDPPDAQCRTSTELEAVCWWPAAPAHSSSPSPSQPPSRRRSLAETKTHRTSHNFTRLVQLEAVTQTRAQAGGETPRPHRQAQQPRAPARIQLRQSREQCCQVTPSWSAACLASR